MEGGEEVSGGFLAACGDASEVFDRVEETLNKVALLIQGKVAIAFDDAV